MERRAAAAVLLLLCAAGASASSRFLDRSGGGLDAGRQSSLLTSLMSAMLRMGKGKGDYTNEPAMVAIRFEVPPRVADKFVDEWLRFEKGLRDLRGLDFYQLSKATTCNTEYWSYAEWDTMQDLMDNCGSREAEDFMAFVDDNDILTEVFPLEAAGDAKREYRAVRDTADVAADGLGRKKQRRGDADEETFDPRDSPAHLSMIFHVPPHKCDEFEDTFMDVQSRVAKKERDNRFYVLRKFATMNHRYILRAGWDDLDAYMDHMTSGHCADLREFAKDADVEWKAIPFRVLASSEEEDTGRGRRRREVDVPLAW